MEIQVQTQIWEENDRIAEELAEKWQDQGTLVLNLLGSPGAGKTTFLEKTLDILKDRYRIGVIEGDLFTAQDAERIKAKGIEAVQINTGGGCHLDAPMVREALKQLSEGPFDLLVIENVGNLVCPAEFYLGEDHKVTLLSVTEGEDKPLKYPLIFKESAFVGLTKSDLLPHLDYQLDRVLKDLGHLNPKGEVVTLSSRSGENMEKWFTWLETNIRMKQEGKR
ncbi:MAG: hydrogenase nickel incorporation protein HypB [Negativicutes bacterium]|jgi:hydrogenase nickel incorporation protein HypB|nr:hydrogenase nickel incorporation protein HypB [Negativicutes bacterium]